jgi:hypothetical protein
MSWARKIIVGYFVVCGLVYAVLGVEFLSNVETVARATSIPGRYPVLPLATLNFIDLLPSLPGILLAAGAVAALALVALLRFVKDPSHRFVWASFIGMLYTHLAMTMLTFAAICLVLLPEMANPALDR